MSAIDKLAAAEAAMTPGRWTAQKRMDPNFNPIVGGDGFNILEPYYYEYDEAAGSTARSEDAAGIALLRNAAQALIACARILSDEPVLIRDEKEAYLTMLAFRKRVASALAALAAAVEGEP